MIWTRPPSPQEGEDLLVEPERAFSELSRLKSEGFNVLVDMTAVDYSAMPLKPGARGEGSWRFEVVYRLMKLDAADGMDKGRVQVRARVPEGEPALRSAASLWPIADWLEREVWDMFGIGFVDRPGIKRLLMYEEFAGHPLRKDYPIAKRQPLIGPPSGERADNPSFNRVEPTVKFE